MINTKDCWRLVALVICWVVVWPVGAAEKVNAPGQTNSRQAVVTYCVDPDWAPFEQIDPQGKHVGISADLLSLVGQRSGLNLQLLVTKDWEESIRASQDGRCTLMSFLNQTPEREAWLMFTEPLLVDENVLITREEHPFISDLASLDQASMVLPKGTSVEERVRHDYPNIRLTLVDSEAIAFKMVSERQADMTMRSLIVAADTIKHQGWFNLKIAGQVPGYGNQLRIGVAKNQAKLRDVLNVAVQSITPVERQLIVNRHTAINFISAIDYTLVKWLLALVVAVGLTSFFWILRLRQLNAKLKALSHTDDLTGLQNRTGLDAIFKDELERSQRFTHALSIMILDIDFFKRVNDELGHLAGDLVLKEIAQVLRQQVRTIDILMRWGGEEFLVICPGTSADKAVLLAERILQAVRDFRSSAGCALTLSAGVASLNAIDPPEKLFVQADLALYQAKASGRNRVVLYSGGA